MKKLANKFLSVILISVMVFGIAAAGGSLTLNASAAAYKTGDFIEFGSYPQSKVTDYALLSVLNPLISTYSWENDWVSYRYYSGNGEFGSGVQGDWMKYVDVDYGAERYRAVKFTQHRPNSASSESSSEGSCQRSNRYFPNNVYWFKFEPIKWRILDPEKGLLMTELCVDSQAYNDIYYWDGVERWGNEEHTIFANDYVTSSIRKWLNEYFYDTAFSEAQKTQMVRTLLNNTSPFREGMYSSASTNDMVFLPSYYDVINSDYGFEAEGKYSDIARLGRSTDYADAQGFFNVARNGEKSDGLWFLRSPGYNGGSACYVHMDGTAYTEMYVDYTYMGIRPTITLDFATLHTHNEATEYSCNAEGHWNACSECKTKLNFEKHIPGEPATQDTPQTCTVCGYEIAPALSHAHAWAAEYSRDENGHWYACSGCNVKADYEKHIPGAPATDTTAQVCTACGYELIPAIASTRFLMGIEVASYPYITDLTYKKYASSDGLKVIAKFSDGEKRDVTGKAKLSKFSSDNKQGTYAAQVEYEGFTATFNYTVRYTWWQWIILILLLGIFWY